MTRTLTAPQRAFFASLLCMFALLWMGCPDTSPGEKAPTSDGGEVTPEGSPALTKCPINAVCVFVGDPTIRSCAILLKGKAKGNARVTFSADVLGRSKRQGEQVGIVFIAQKHEPFEASSPLASIPPHEEGKPETWAIEKMDCYDMKGVRVDAPQVRLEKR